MAICIYDDPHLVSESALLFCIYCFLPDYLFSSTSFQQNFQLKQRSDVERDRPSTRNGLFIRVNLIMTRGLKFCWVKPKNLHAPWSDDEENHRKEILCCGFGVCIDDYTLFVFPTGSLQLNLEASTQFTEYTWNPLWWSALDVSTESSEIWKLGFHTGVIHNNYWVWILQRVICSNNDSNEWHVLFSMDRLFWKAGKIFDL